jgi:hypothetical protein
MPEIVGSKLARWNDSQPSDVTASLAVLRAPLCFSGDRRTNVRRLGVAVMASALLLGFVWAFPAVAVGGNLDAAHACQQGGYASLRGTDGTVFKNVGECVSYVARGGTIQGVATACAYTPGTSGCVEFDNVTLAIGDFTSPGSTSTTLAGMLSFTPATDWPVWVSGSTAVSISGSGTWATSTGLSGTWMATHTSSIYAGTFTNAVGASPCGTADARYIGVHLDVYKGGVLDGAIELQLRDATTGTNYVLYQGFTTNTGGDPYGLHTTTNVSGVTLRC